MEELKNKERRETKRLRAEQDDLMEEQDQEMVSVGSNEEKERNENEGSAISKKGDKKLITPDKKTGSIKKYLYKKKGSSPSSYKEKEVFDIDKAKEEFTRKKAVQFTKYKAVIDFTVRLHKVGAEDAKGHKTRNKLLDKLAEAIVLIRKIADPNAQYVAKEGSDKLPIANRGEMPYYAIDAKDYFHVYNSTRAYLPISRESKLIRGSAILAGNIEIDELISLAEEDLNDEDIHIKLKPLQVLETVQNYVLVGIPREILASVVEVELKKILDNLGSSCPDFAVTQGYPPGMPYDENEFKKRRAGLGKYKLTFNIHVSSKEEGKLRKLLEETKRKGLLVKKWGKCAFALKIPDDDDTDAVKESYVRKINIHEMCMRNMGFVMAYISWTIKRRLSSKMKMVRQKKRKFQSKTYWTLWRSKLRKP